MPDDVPLSWSRIEAFRENSFGYKPGKRLRYQQDAIRFVIERGFIFFWPIAGFDLPSLWVAVAGNRPVPNNHDDPAHITWRWKDDLLGKGIWYYAKILRQKGTLISLDLLPCFYALSPNYGSPEEDYMITYQEGKLTLEEKQVYEALLDQGPLDSLALRQQSRLSSRGNSSRFNRALNSLMRDFRILPVGIAEAGTWNYAYVYDVVHRSFPDLVETSHQISESEARMRIINSYFLSVGASQSSAIRRLLQWPDRLLEKTLIMLQSANIIHRVKLSGLEGDWWVLTSLT